MYSVRKNEEKEKRTFEYVAESACLFFFTVSLCKVNKKKNKHCQEKGSLMGMALEYTNPEPRIDRFIPIFL
jgi:hypothetical protein